MLVGLNQSLNNNGRFSGQKKMVENLSKKYAFVVDWSTNNRGDGWG